VCLRSAACFIRFKPSGERGYLQIVENSRDGLTTRQSVLATLGRLAQNLSADLSSHQQASVVSTGSRTER
jgi:hypothetical protein